MQLLVQSVYKMFSNTVYELIYRCGNNAINYFPGIAVI